MSNRATSTERREGRGPRAIGILLCVSVFLAAQFAIAGAGIFGSPFGPGKTPSEYTIYAAAILVGPATVLVAMCLYWFQRGWAGMALILGAVAGLVVGLGVPSDFLYFWGKVFLVCIWGPMIFVGARLLFRVDQCTTKSSRENGHRSVIR